MFLTVLNFIKAKKTIISGIGVLATVLGLYVSWGNIKESHYNEGFQAAVQEYQVKMIEQQAKYKEETESRILQLRETLNRQYKEELERVKSESKVDAQVKTITKYLEKEVHVKEECNTVPVDLNRMLNESINSINGSTSD